MNPVFWHGKKVLITGHTGFKGSWLSLWLTSLGAEVVGFALEPNTTPNLFNEINLSRDMVSIIGDVRDAQALHSTIEKYQPEIILHLAAQALVRYGYQNPTETYATNVMGTVNLLEAVRTTKLSHGVVVVNVTTDKCYENKEWLWGYRENEAMGGYDPYSSSKGCSELVTSAYRNSFFNPQHFDAHGVALASARAGNVIGGGDWAVDRLIPDIIASCLKKQNVLIRNPHAIRPWQHVLEPLSGYLQLAEAMYHKPRQFCAAWNFGPNEDDVKPVQWIVDYLLKQWCDNLRATLDSNSNPHEANFLKLDCSKAKALLAWQPRWSLPQALNSIVAWYQAYQHKQDLRAVTLAQINDYLN